MLPFRLPHVDWLHRDTLVFSDDNSGCWGWRRACEHHQNGTGNPWFRYKTYGWRAAAERQWKKKQRKSTHTALDGSSLLHWKQTLQQRTRPSYIYIQHAWIKRKEMLHAHRKRGTCIKDWLWLRGDVDMLVRRGKSRENECVFIMEMKQPARQYWIGGPPELVLAP